MRSASPLQGALLPLPSLPSPTACWPHGCYYTSSMLYLETWHSLFPWPGSWDGEIILDYPSGSSVIKRPITKERKREITAREEGKAMWWWKWTLSWCGHKSRNVRSHRKLEETRNSFSTRISGGNAAMPTPCFWFNDTGFRLLGFRTVGKEFLLFSGTKFAVILYNSHRKIIQYYFLTLLIYP